MTTTTKPKRRTAGQGSIYKDEEGWHGWLVVYDAKGRRHRLHRRAQTRREVVLKVEDERKRWQDLSIPANALHEAPLSKRVRELEQRVAYLEAYLGERQERSVRSRMGVAAAVRLRVLERDQFTCRYCGETPPRYALEIDHVIPISAGGKTTDDNLVTACLPCNRRKGANHPDVVGMTLLHFPATDGN